MFLSAVYRHRHCCTVDAIGNSAVCVVFSLLWQLLYSFGGDCLPLLFATDADVVVPSVVPCVLIRLWNGRIAVVRHRIIVLSMLLEIILLFVLFLVFVAAAVQWWWLYTVVICYGC